MHTPAGHVTSLPERMKKETVIIVIVENGLSAIAPGHHMVKGPWRLNSNAARHETIKDR
jgi:hypothetical protein